MAHDVFISHSTNNRPVANAVCAALESAAIRCWIAPRDVLPGRSYSGEITRAIQQSKAFVLIFSEHSNNSEQVLREVQLAANSRLHIVQFRIDAVIPNDDLEYYLSGPHWLDALTPPLEDHLERLQSSMKALLGLAPTGEKGKVAVTDPAKTATGFEAVRPTRPPGYAIASSFGSTAAVSKPSANVWKWVALAAVGLAVLGCIALVFMLKSHSGPVTTTAPPSASPSTAPQTLPVIQPSANPQPSSVTQIPKPPTLATGLISATEAESLIKSFYRDMERGDLSGALSYIDTTVDYYAFGPKDKAFVGDQLRQYFAVFPVRTFVVGEVNLQDSSKPMVATVIFDVRYSARDALGVPNSGHTHVEWDLAKRTDGFKIVRSNWITYPDSSPSP